MSGPHNLEIQIKHMVCPRCIDTVRRIAAELGLDVCDVSLGSIELRSPLPVLQQSKFAEALHRQGFEILESREARLVNRIKSIVIEGIHYQDGSESTKLSVVLAQELHRDYSQLSKLFSKSEGITIERFATLQRLERAKELITYEDLSMTQIAEEVGYSSPSHLSSQFRRETGLTPTQFRKLKPKTRRGLESI